MPSPIKTTSAPPDGAAVEPQDDELGNLAQEARGDVQQEQVEQEAARQAEPGLPPEFIEAIARIPLFIIRAVRANIAKRVPEIMEEWPDDMLTAHAAAWPPVVAKYAAKMAPKIAQYPEESVLVLSLVPLCGGYFTASMRSQAKPLPMAERVDMPAPAAEVAPAAPQGFVGVPGVAEG